MWQRRKGPAAWPRREAEEACFCLPRSSVVAGSEQHRAAGADGPSLREGRVQSHSGYFHLVLHAEGGTRADTSSHVTTLTPSHPFPAAALK